ncbi:MAG: hypothetical protein MJ188_08980 [Treponema sp.]|nr:hypothetical protein [Treponema sp.]
MKKRIGVCGLVCAILLVTSFTSCVSLPKKVKPGTALVIMGVSFEASDYEYVQGKKTNVQLTLRDVNNGKTYTAYTNEDNLGVFKVAADRKYKLSQVKYTGSSGEALWVDINASSWETFYAEEGAITNIGYWKFSFDGTKNWVTWNKMNYSDSEKDFKAIDSDSEWMTRKILRK